MKDVTDKIIIFLGLLVIITAGGALALQFYDKSVPDSLLALGSGALGALAGYLQKERSHPETIEAEKIQTDELKVGGA